MARGFKYQQLVDIVRYWVVVIGPFLGVFTAKVFFRTSVLPKSRGFDVFKRRNGITLRKVGRVLPLPESSFVVALLNLARLLLEIESPEKYHNLT